ncbi:MAG TPA: peptidyl-prolyl cis-trans isomerase [Solirubrobacteraceae bacterium]|nr:peptidyl-prolyl cis-trans isomerase [Solirubrobacteraceae bacterium]
MKRLARPIAALGAVFFACIAFAACGGVPSDSIATVEGNAIKNTTFDHWLQVAATTSAGQIGGAPVVPMPPSYGACIAHLESVQSKAKGVKPKTHEELKKQCETQYESLKKEVVNYLISSEWVLGEAKNLDVKVTDSQVHKEFEKIRDTQFPSTAEFEKFLKSSGQTVSDLLLRVKLNMLSQKIQHKVLTENEKVSEEEIKKYYEENKSTFGTPETRSVELVLTKTEQEAKEAKKEIESGKSWDEVAKARSIDPVSKAKGGLLKEVVKGQEAKALSEAIFSAPLNTLSGPVKTPFGYYIYEVKSIHPGTSKPLSKEHKRIKEQLSVAKDQKALAKFVKEFKEHWKDQTECREGFVVPNCKEYTAPKSAAKA